MKTQFWFAVGLTVVTLLVLTGCEAKLKVESKPNEPTVVTIPYAQGGTASMQVSEVCYDGVLYLVNTKGGMTAKINQSSIRTSFSVSLSPFVKCD